MATRVERQDNQTIMKIAMIGAGGYARAHLDVLEKEPGLSIVGHVSPTVTSREAASQRYGGRAYESVEKLLDNEQLDAAWISVPPYAHGEIETAFIDEGIPFFVEKPLSVDGQTAEDIAEKIAKRNLIVGVGYKFRALSALPEVRATLEDYPPHLMLAAWHGGTPSASWWQRQEMSGGQIIEQATHLVDLARYLLGEAKVIGATAKHTSRSAFPDLDVATTSTATLEFDSGVTGFVSATCLLEGGRDVYLKLVCEGLLVTIRPESIVFETGGERRELITLDNLVALEDRAFLQAVRQNDSSLLFCTYEDALRTHKLCIDTRQAPQFL